MSIETYLRLLVQGDKEFKCSALTVTDTATPFVSQVAEFRKHFYAYNNSDGGSGEVYWGESDVEAGSGMLLPKGALWELPIAPKNSGGTAIPVYFIAASGEIADLRFNDILNVIA